MCLIAFAWQTHDDYPLIVAANRDEFFARPTERARWWPRGEMLAGRDLRGGGTWMGVTRDGRFAALTNYRDPASFRTEAPSRGELVGRYLVAEDPDGALARIADERARFNGFNLLAARWSGDPSDRRMAVVCHPGPAHAAVVTPGVHALSNAHLDTAWPKVDAITAHLAEAIDDVPSSELLIARLFAMLSDRSIASDDRLPTTGVPPDFERALSAVFIRMPGYGTRSSTVLLVDRAGRATFVERRTEPDLAIDELRFEFDPVSAVRAS